jgi:hypothetical protein
VRKLLIVLVTLTLTVPLAVPVAAKERAMEPKEVTVQRPGAALLWSIRPFRRWIGSRRARRHCQTAARWSDRLRLHQRAISRSCLVRQSARKPGTSTSTGSRLFD